MRFTGREFAHDHGRWPVRGRAIPALVTLNELLISGPVIQRATKDFTAPVKRASQGSRASDTNARAMPTSNGKSSTERKAAFRARVATNISAIANAGSRTAGTIDSVTPNMRSSRRRNTGQSTRRGSPEARRQTTPADAGLPAGSRSRISTLSTRRSAGLVSTARRASRTFASTSIITCRSRRAGLTNPKTSCSRALRATSRSATNSQASSGRERSNG